jgi:predicted ribosome quality control (RQC) complex YloA/Tae2 family protein
VSNAIRYDSLLVRELARELDEALAGSRLFAALLDRARLRFALQVAPARRDQQRPPSLLWQLHPSAGHLTRAQEGFEGAAVPLRGRPPIRGVHAPADERIIIITLDVDDASPAGVARRLIIELITNQWNVVATGADDRIVSVLRERSTRERELRPGAAYLQPSPSGRLGAHGDVTREEWLRVLGPVPPGERLPVLPRIFAWTSPLNAAWIIGDADVVAGEAALERAYRRHQRLAGDGRLPAVLVQQAGGWQPYVGLEQESGEPMPDLLRAFGEAARRAEAAPPADADVEQALAVIATRLDLVQKRLRRLEEERGGAAEESVRLRRQADLLLSQLHAVARGAGEVVLDDMEGGTIAITLDPALTPAENARRIYDTARRRERAAARVPALLEAGRAERVRLEALAGRVAAGTATPGELERLQQRRAARERSAAPLPYRSYRTRGGLEVRVGRGSRANDELTFRHSHREDVWLHARDVAGAHVILRWGRSDANPPAADIADAAVLAALHSRARTSGTVPVDWTRRKHVRKPRKAGPGLVVPERVRTVFVEPDRAAEERMRLDDELAQD